MKKILIVIIILEILFISLNYKKINEMDLIEPLENEEIHLEKNENDKKNEANEYSIEEIKLFEFYADKIMNTYIQIDDPIVKMETQFYLYNGEKMIVDNYEIPKGTNRPGIVRKEIKYIVIHDTGNYNKNANAYNNYLYLTNSESSSWHYTIDENKILHHIPDNEVAYHAGDGLREYGNVYFNKTYNYNAITGGNYNGIGIETCVNNGSDYIKTLKNTAWLISELNDKYNIGIENIKKHMDFSGKQCPYVIIRYNLWNELIKYVELINFYNTYMTNYNIEFVNLINVNEEGKVINKENKNISITFRFFNDDKQYIIKKEINRN